MQASTRHRSAGLSVHMRWSAGLSAALLGFLVVLPGAGGQGVRCEQVTYNQAVILVCERTPGSPGASATPTPTATPSPTVDATGTPTPSVAPTAEADAAADPTDDDDVVSDRGSRGSRGVRDVAEPTSTATASAVPAADADAEAEVDVTSADTTDAGDETSADETDHGDGVTDAAESSDGPGEGGGAPWPLLGGAVAFSALAVLFVASWRRPPT